MLIEYFGDKYKKNIENDSSEKKAKVPEKKKVNEFQAHQDEMKMR